MVKLNINYDIPVMVNSCQEFAENDITSSLTMRCVRMSGFDKFMDKVFEAIRDKRQTLGMSQGEMSTRMGKPQSSIARLESGGVRDPRISMFYQAAKALEVNPAEFLGWAYDQVEVESNSKKEGEDWRIDKIRNRLKLLDEPTRKQVAEIIEGVLKLT